MYWIHWQSWMTQLIDSLNFLTDWLTTWLSHKHIWSTDNFNWHIYLIDWQLWLIEFFEWYEWWIDRKFRIRMAKSLVKLVALIYEMTGDGLDWLMALSEWSIILILLTVSFCCSIKYTSRIRDQQSYDCQSSDCQNRSPSINQSFK